MRYSRPKLVAAVALVLVLTVAGAWGAWWAGTSARMAYSGHRLLVWAIDKKGHDVAGFAEGTVRPGGSIELKPAEGFAVRCEAGEVEGVTVTDFQREWTEDLIRFKIAHGRSSSEGMKPLSGPFLSLEYGIGEPVGAVLIGIPIGSFDLRPLREVLGHRGRPGTAAGLEDLLFAMLGEPETRDWMRTADVIEIYRMLGRSCREARWRERLAGRTPPTRREAAAVLMMVGDPAGTSVFCRECLQATGNDQVRLIDVLAEMPPSDEALATIVKLIVAPGRYLLRVPGAGVADIERRFVLVRALAEKYPKEKVRRYADELRAYARSLPEGSGVRRSLGEMLDLR